MAAIRYGDGLQFDNNLFQMTRDQTPWRDRYRTAVSCEDTPTTVSSACKVDLGDGCKKMARWTALRTPAGHQSFPLVI